MIIKVSGTDAQNHANDALSHAYSTFVQAAEKIDIRTYANSKDPDHPAHPRSPVRVFAVRLHNIGTLLKIYVIAKILSGVGHLYVP